MPSRDATDLLTPKSKIFVRTNGSSSGGVGGVGVSDETAGADAPGFGGLWCRSRCMVDSADGDCNFRAAERKRKEKFKQDQITCTLVILDCRAMDARYGSDAG